MKNFTNDLEKYQRAKKQVTYLKEFYIHFIWFIFGNAFCLFLNLKYSPQYLWVLWQLTGWSIGLFFHASYVFNWFNFDYKNWEDKKIKEFMEEEKQQQKLK